MELLGAFISQGRKNEADSCWQWAHYFDGKYKLFLHQIFTFYSRTIKSVSIVVSSCQAVKQRTFFNVNCQQILKSKQLDFSAAAAALFNIDKLNIK